MLHVLGIPERAQSKALRPRRLPGRSAKACIHLALAGLLLAGCQTMPERPCRLAFATDLPFTVQRSHIAITPFLDGKQTDMWLDTGAVFTTLSTDSAHRLSLRIEELPGFLEGIGGSRQVYGFVAKRLQLGRLQGRNFRLAAADIGLSGQGYAADGLLGADFLAAYDVDVDVAGRKVSLFRTTAACSAPTTNLDGELYEIPMSRNANAYDLRPHIRVQIGDRTLTALLDTGAPHSVVFRDAAHGLGLDIESLTADKHFREGGVGPDTRDAVRHVLTPVTIGELTVSHLPVAIIDQRAPPDADMLLGMDFMSRVHTWFSFSSRTIILQYPPLPSPNVAIPPPAPDGR